MRLNANLRFWVTTIALWLMIQGVPLSVSESLLNTEFEIGMEAVAKKSGGRSRGGSFGSSSGRRSRSGGNRSRSSGSTSSGGSSRPRSSGSSSSPTNRSGNSSSSTPSLEKSPTSTSRSQPKPSVAPNSSNSNSTGGRIRGGSFAPPPPPPRPSHAAPPPPPPKPVIPVPVPVPISGDRRPAEDVLPRTDPPPAPPAPPPPGSHLEPHQPLNSAPPPPHRHRRPDRDRAGAYASHHHSRANWMGLVLWLLIIGGVVFIAYLIFSRRSPGNELDNDIVTVSKLQVALLAPEGDLQQQLTQLTLNGDTETPEGLIDMLQEGALALMRRSDRWCYVSSSSQTVYSREEAQQLFEQLSLEERSKFTSETLVNVNGAVQEKLAALSQEISTPGSYVVVTFLVGTADDQPLFKDIQTPESLREVLGRLGAISPDYLLVFELLWSPQEESANLSSDELLTSYSHMIPL
ncbi:MAG: DUF1517 domain-containing protein [Roseofilum sp. SID1]|uniref:DUF1517 domain-containing protein n=1 Tax=Roseofilum sp. SID1 TaxID=2821497 RepID=UPI001B1CC42F|nr:DUF1517 domain-containing protein [Roseofilum sp. SID1]MBP0039657.1 DUF1517 domain-containing protein [Roseofilum sp. SID1]